MNIKDYMNSYENSKNNYLLKTLVLVVFIIFTAIFINDRFYLYNYYETKGVVIDKFNVSLLVSLSDLEIFENKNKLICSNREVPFKVKKLSEENVGSNGVYYREVLLECKCGEIKNNLIDIKIVKNKKRIFDIIKEILGG